MSASQTFNLTTDGSEPTATYTGDVYDASNLPVGFLPTQLEVAYNLPAAYNQGLTGAGQTIVCLRPTGTPLLNPTPMLTSPKRAEFRC